LRFGPRGCGLVWSGVVWCGCGLVWFGWVAVGPGSWSVRGCPGPGAFPPRSAGLLLAGRSPGCPVPRGAFGARLPGGCPGPSAAFLAPSVPRSSPSAVCSVWPVPE